MFKEIRKQIKDIENGASELNQSFEGEFFADSPWFLSNLDFEGFSELEIASNSDISAPIESIQPKATIETEKVIEVAKVEVKEKASKPKEAVKIKKKAVDEPVSTSFSAAYEALGPGFSPKKKTNGGKLEANVEISSDISQYIKEVNQKEIDFSTINGMNAIDLESGIRVLFVGEGNIPNISEHEEAHFHSDSNRTDLLGKMIGAMKLSAGEFVRSSMVEYDGSSEESIQKNLNNICQEIALLKPSIVISLGAVSTNLLLGKKERLSQVHGEFFTRQYSFTSGEELDFIMIPIFHPDFLEINPSMKRTAWLDLQKVMELWEIPLK